MLRGELWCAATCVLALTASAASGQEVALRVVVADPSEARVPRAQVKLEIKQSAPRLAITDQAGEVRFVDLPLARARITVEATGFVPRTVNLRLGHGENSVEFHLRIQALREVVEVRTGERDDATSNPALGFSTVLTPEQINNLPDDPDEMKAQLQRMAGPDAVILVDGFSANRLPPKSQIASIRIRLSSYAAEDHDFGFAIIDIRTKPGYFAPAREPGQMRRINADVSGPLWRDRTSLSLWFSRGFSYESSATFGVTPAGRFSNLVRVPLDYDRLGVRLLHNATKNHRVLVEFDHWTQLRGMVGQFDLPERLVNTRWDLKDLKLAVYGVLSSRVLNDIRFRATWNGRSSSPVSDAPALIVNGAFSAGGAAANSRRSTASFQLTDDLRMSLAGHGLSAGFQIFAEPSREHNLTNGNGTFVFPSLAAYEAGTPSLYSRLVGDTVVGYEQYQFAGYVQDEFRARPNLSLSVGVRWEAQTHVRGLSNFAPRLGFAWSPFRQASTTLRGGFGLFYQWISADVYGQTLRFNGLNQDTLVILNPGFPDPLQAGTAVSLPPTLFLHASSLRLPYLLRSSVAVQQSIRSLKLMTEVRWQRGVRLPLLNNLNQPLPGTGRPNPLEGNVFQVQNGADSLLKEWFTSLSGDFRRFLWTLSYTLGSQTNQVDGPWQTPSNPRNLAADRGPAGNDVRHRLNGYLTYRFPKGFRFSLSPSFSSGLAYNITTGFDDNGDTVFNDRPASVGRNTGRGAPTWSVDGRLAWTRAFGPESTERARSYEFRVDPGSRGGSFELEVPKQKFQVQTYVQAFNLFNHANFLNYAGILTSPSFGQPTAAMPGRRLEVGLRFLF
ncbi:MAG: TonB-dependent receptor [Acidobacteria bacterium]|nr:TonB-dependent receptor [Acidobacteriota bacterium]